MGYRERGAHRNQQKQQALSKGYQQEQRTTLPAPVGMNRRDDIISIGVNEAAYIDNAIGRDAGLQIRREPSKRVVLGTASPEQVTLISYTGSGSASQELWAISNRTIYNIGEVLDSSATATASAISAPNASGTMAGGDYIQFRNTIIYVNSNYHPLKWTRASGWENWSATVSGGDIKNSDGIVDFKSRVFTWKRGSSAFHYGDVDQFLGTLNTFNLETVLGEGIRFITSMTRDGGSGPDDYLMVVGETGRVAVYQGTNPADALQWSLVGVYKIGVPVSHDSFVKYGDQVFVLCEDDIYTIPSDLTGKRQSSTAVGDRRRGPGGSGITSYINGVHWEKENIIVFADGSVLNPVKGFAFTKAKLGINRFGNKPNDGWQKERGFQDSSDNIAVYRDRLYGADETSASGSMVLEIMPDSNTSNYNTRIITAPIPLSGRTNISLVNAVFGTRTDPFVPSTGNETKYKTAVVYDQEHKDVSEATASAGLWVEVTASADSEGLWTPGFGTGRMAQVQIEMLSATASAEIFLKRIDLTLSDTGGL